MAIFPVLLSGGSGTRLWPVSRAARPKQFLSLSGQSDDSLIVETLHRLRTGPDIHPPTLLCNHDHRFLVADALAQAGLAARSILLEPVARNTAPAITVAALSAFREDAEACIAVMPCDHAIGDVDAFRTAVAKASELARQGRLVLFGVSPSEAHTGYGYIRRGAPLTPGDDNGFVVSAFKEKPDRATAEAYLADRSMFWNAGIFVLNCRTFLDEVKARHPDMMEACAGALDGAKSDLCFERLDDASFARNPDISVDYAIMENTEKAAMVPLDAGWSDIGSWPAFRALHQPDEDGNVLLGRARAEGSKDCLISSESALVAALGVDDLVIVESEDAVLVTSSDMAQEVGGLVKHLRRDGVAEADTHRRHFRPWGHFDILNEGSGFKVKRIGVKSGCRLSLQRHRHRSEHWVVVSGEALVTRGERTERLYPNQSAYISAGEWHRLENEGPEALEIIEVQIGTYLGEDDIERAGDDYNR